MGRIKGYYEWDDDELTPGNKREGGLHQNLFDDEGNLRGSARFVPLDGDEDTNYVSEYVFVPVEERRKTKEQEELEETIAALMLVLVVEGVERAKPHVEQWWHSSFKPFVSRQWSKIRGKGRTEDEKITDGVAGSLASFEQKQPETDVAVNDRDRPRMSSAEAQVRMLAALAAQAFADEQLRLIKHSEIIDGDGVAGARGALAKMPSELVGDLLKQLATNPNLLTDESLAELASVLAQQSSRERAIIRSNEPIPGSAANSDGSKDR